MHGNHGAATLNRDAALCENAVERASHAGIVILQQVSLGEQSKRHTIFSHNRRQN